MEGEGQLGGWRQSVAHVSQVLFEKRDDGGSRKVIDLDAKHEMRSLSNRVARVGDVFGASGFPFFSLQKQTPAARAAAKIAAKGSQFRTLRNIP